MARYKWDGLFLCLYLPSLSLSTPHITLYDHQKLLHHHRRQHRRWQINPRPPIIRQTRLATGL